MRKILLLFLMLLVVGCSPKIDQNDGKERIYLNDIYYNKGEYIKTSKEELENKTEETYLLFTYNSYCNFPTPVDKIFQKFMDKYKIDILSIPFADFKETSFYGTIKYAPSVIIISNNKVISYLDAEKDEDLDKYQNAKEFESWLNEYIYFNKNN